MKSMILLLLFLNFLFAFNENEIKELELELDKKIKTNYVNKKLAINKQDVKDVYDNYTLIVKNYDELKAGLKELKEIYNRSEKIRNVYDKYVTVVKDYMNGTKSYIKQKALCGDMEDKFKNSNRPSDYSLIKLQK